MMILLIPGTNVAKQATQRVVMGAAQLQSTEILPFHLSDPTARLAMVMLDDEYAGGLAARALSHLLPTSTGRSPSHALPPCPNLRWWQQQQRCGLCVLLFLQAAAAVVMMMVVVVASVQLAPPMSHGARGRRGGGRRGGVVRNRDRLIAASAVVAAASHSHPQSA